MYVYTVIWEHEGIDDTRFRKRFNKREEAVAFRNQLVDEGEEAQVVVEKVRTPIKKKWWNA
mgnify:CR=1 FL=1